MVTHGTRNQEKDSPITPLYLLLDRTVSGEGLVKFRQGIENLKMCLQEEHFAARHFRVTLIAFSGDKVETLFESETPETFHIPELTPVDDTGGLAEGMEALEKCIVGDAQSQGGAAPLGKPIICVFSDRPDEHFVFDSIRYLVGADCPRARVILVYSADDPPLPEGITDELIWERKVVEAEADDIEELLFGDSDEEDYSESDEAELVKLEAGACPPFSINPKQDLENREGAEKVVFLSTNSKWAVGLYLKRNKPNKREQRLDRLNQIIEKHTDKIKDDQNLFCWPMGVINDFDQKVFPEDPWENWTTPDGEKLTFPVLAVVERAIHKKFYWQFDGGSHLKTFDSLMMPAFLEHWEASPQSPNLLQRAEICKSLTRAVQVMHTAGLAHSDLSWKNVLGDPETGKACLIDCDSLHFPGHVDSAFADEVVKGTPLFQAPELRREGERKTPPSIEADRYSLAKLIYGLLMFSGEGTGGIPLSSQFFDAVKLVQPDSQDTERFGAQGPEIKELFERAFIEGWDNYAKRPTARDWNKALINLIGRLGGANG